MTKLTRREFLGALAAAGVATASASWLADRLFAMVEEGALPAPRGPGVETWVPTLCRLCPAACGIRVRLVDGLPVGLEGNRTNPVSAGGLCPAGLALLQELVHPDRLRNPLRRAGPRGSGKWTSISWDQALEEMAVVLRRLRSEGRPQELAVLDRGDSPLTSFWIERVLRSFGSPNAITRVSPEAWRCAWAYMAGASPPPAADLAHSDFILSFGHELLETDGHPVWQSKVWGRTRGGPASRAVTLAFVGSRFSPTASRADLRTAVHSGTEGTMALGLIYILVMEGLVDRSFLERWTSDWHGPRGGSEGPEGFESFIRRRYNPEEVSRVTGVPVSEMFRLGRAFGLSQQPVALVGPRVLAEREGLATAMAVVALNLAVGAVGRPGGYVACGAAPLDLPPRVEPDAVARRGLAAPRVDGVGVSTLPVVQSSLLGFAAALAGGRPYPLGFLFVHGVNPVHEWPGGRALEVLAKVGFVVSMGRMPDETAWMADLVLPEASELESWQIVPSPPGIPFNYAGLQQPAIRPLYEARPFEDVWFALARAVGGPVAAAVPAGSYAEWLPEAAGGLFRAGRGTIAGGTFHERIADFMQARGWKVPGPASLQAFWDELRRSGSWVDMPEPLRSPREVLAPGAERFDFWPPRLLENLEALTGRMPPDEALYVGRGDASAEPAAEVADERYPLRLLLFDTNTLWDGRAAATPLMLEMSGHREDISWDSWIEIHPETARRSGITEGERVRVESAHSSLVVRTRIAPVVPADAVAIPRGLGHRHFGRFAAGVGVNPMALVAARADAWTGAAVLATRVRVAPLPD